MKCGIFDIFSTRIRQIKVDHKRQVKEKEELISEIRNSLDRCKMRENAETYYYTFNEAVDILNRLQVEHYSRDENVGQILREEFDKISERVSSLAADNIILANKVKEFEDEKKDGK